MFVRQDMFVRPWSNKFWEGPTEYDPLAEQISWLTLSFIITFRCTDVVVVLSNNKGEGVSQSVVIQDLELCGTKGVTLPLCSVGPACLLLHASVFTALGHAT